MRIRKALSGEKCRNLISIFDDIEYSPKIKKGPPNNYCIQKNIHYYEYLQLNPSDAPFNEELIAGLRTYADENQFLKTRRWGLVNECRIQKYQPGKSYSVEHCEHGQGKIDSLIIIAWMFYLNSIPSNDGGRTRFPQQDISFEAEEGDLLIWPAFWTHSHYGEATKLNKKYIITGWCRYKMEDLQNQ